jgi:ribonuclease PH
MGDTKVICCASIEENVPPHKKGSNSGWVTAEYGMLPRSTTQRMKRESSTNHARGRTQEIQRLIGRSLRAITNLELLGERTIVLDADVIQADGGTRTAGITGSFIALHDAVSKLLKDGKIKRNPLKEYLAAISVGKMGDALLLDLDYSEDSQADVDMNIIMTESGRFVEIQGTAEVAPFGKDSLFGMLDLASSGIKSLIKIQKEILS